MSALIDTGFLVALLSREDKHHVACSQQFVQERGLMIPLPVLTELAYMLTNRGKRRNFTDFLPIVTSGSMQLLYPSAEDLLRTRDLMTQYADARIDFVDCIVVAMAERLNVTRILTVDQRDFRMVRPNHTIAFTILP